MSTTKINGEFIWTKKPGDYPFFKTQDGRYFTYASWMHIIPSNSDVKMYIAKCTNKHHSEKFRYKIYEVPKDDVKDKRFDRWKWFSMARYVIVEITNPQTHRPKLIK